MLRIFFVRGQRVFSGYPQALIILNPFTMTISNWPVASFQWSPPGLDYSKFIYHDNFKVAGGQSSVVTPRS